MESPFLYLFVGFLDCLLGTIPVGRINYGGSKDNYRLRPPQWYRDGIRCLNN